MITFITLKKQYVIAKRILKQQMKSSQSNQIDSKSIIELPSWIQDNQFQVIFNYFLFVQQMIDCSETNKRAQKCMKYFKNQNYQNFNNSKNHSKTNILIMRISDYLTLQKFQQFFIQNCVIQTLNHDNCIIYLEQTHKKLKNTVSGAAQAWYNLLNSCIDYISHNLSQIYLNQTQRIQKLHEKILGEILDRTIKYYTSSGKKNKGQYNKFQQNLKQKQIIFNLLMKSKKATSVDNLCSILKNNLLNKKINKKMHAKLSWKLHDLRQIKDNKIKNFKFFDLNWMLQAVRTPEKMLEIRLKLLPVPNQDIKTLISQNSIGIFYIKLHWSTENYSLTGSVATNFTQKTQQQSLQGQKSLQIHYICLSNPKPINFFTIDSQFEQKLSKKKLELSIYCSTDHCYSFVLNYIIQGYNRLRIDQTKLSKEEIHAIIEGSKTIEKYSQAVWLIKYLANNLKQIPVYLLENIKIQKLPTYETEFLKKLIRNDNPILQQVFGKKNVNEKMLQIQNDLNSLSGSKVSDGERSNKSRNPSKGRHRKIFEDSPNKINNRIILQNNENSLNRQILLQNEMINSLNTNFGENQFQFQQIMRIVNLQSYFYHKNNLGILS